jgi:hypothetical protein
MKAQAATVASFDRRPTGEGGMNAKTWLISFVALAGALVSGHALAQDGEAGTFTVRNDTDRNLSCAVRKAGRTVGEDVALARGKTWTQTYPKAGPRAFRCMDSAPIWYIIRAGMSYRLAANRDGLIVLTAAR